MNLLEPARARDRFAVLVQDGNLMEMIVARIADGESPKDLADTWNVPYSLMAKWIAEDEERRAQYEAALAIRADMEVHEAMRIADQATDETLQVAKLQIDTKLKVAGKWDKQRYGTEGNAGATGWSGGVTIVIGDVEKKFEPKAIEGEVVGSTNLHMD